jgi:hypothetical protein
MRYYICTRGRYKSVARHCSKLKPGGRKLSHLFSVRDSIEWFSFHYETARDGSPFSISNREYNSKSKFWCHYSETSLEGPSRLPRLQHTVESSNGTYITHNQLRTNGFTFTR